MAFSEARSSWRGRRGLAAVALLVAAGVLGGPYVLARRPTLLVMSTLGAPLVVELDGRVVGEADAVPVETPGAGIWARAWPGQQRLVARRVGGDASAAVYDRVVTLAAWETYLFAPASDEPRDALGDQACFFLEHTAYGAATPERPALVALDPRETPWLLPRHLDGLFVPTPRGSPLDRRSTGGTRTTLRQARCGTTPYR